MFLLYKITVYTVTPLHNVSRETTKSISYEECTILLLRKIGHESRFAIGDSLYRGSSCRGLTVIRISVRQILQRQKQRRPFNPILRFRDFSDHPVTVYLSIITSPTEQRTWYKKFFVV